MEVECCCSFPDIEQYTLEQLDELIIEAQRILNARVEKTESLCRWLLLRTHQACSRGFGRHLARRAIVA